MTGTMSSQENGVWKSVRDNVGKSIWKGCHASSFLKKPCANLENSCLPRESLEAPRSPQKARVPQKEGASGMV